MSSKSVTINIIINAVIRKQHVSICRSPSHENYLILRSQKRKFRLDSPEIFRNMKMLTCCKSSGTEYLMINRARVGNFATFKNAKISKYSIHSINKS